MDSYCLVPLAKSLNGKFKMATTKLVGVAASSNPMSDQQPKFYLDLKRHHPAHL